MIPDADFEAKIAGVTFQGGWGVEPGFYLTSVSGLLSGGDVSSDSIPTRGPGVFSTPSRRDDPRIVEFKGEIEDSSMWSLGRRMADLSGLLVEEDDQDELSWYEFGVLRHVLVRRGAGWDIRRDRGVPKGFFTVRFRAPDQRVYGERGTTAWGQSVECRNDGTYPAPVVIEIRGTAAGYTISGPRSRVVQVTRSISSGAPHTYDGDTGLLTVDGVAQMTGVARSDALEIPPGTHTVSVSAGCEIRVTCAPTWVP